MGSWMAEKIPMSTEEFRLFRDMVYNYCGIFFQDDVKYFLERRLNPRLQEKQSASFAEYYRHLRYSPTRRQEMEDMVEVLTTNETYFFREEYQLKAFSEEILPGIIKDKGMDRRLRIWSAGCSTGEEAYTVAILLLEDPRLKGWDMEIFANDISKKVIQIARKGVYGKSSFRSTNPYFLAKYFQTHNSQHLIRDEVRSLVSFGQLNLLDEDMLQLIGKVDVIFCRNVMIYFDKPARLKVLKTFHGKLNDHGYLLLGHSESLMNISTAFELVHLRNDMVYRKPKTIGE